MSTPRPTVEAITRDRIDLAATFLHERLNDAVTTEQWAALFRPPWAADEAPRGFLLTVADRPVGVYAMVVSSRVVGGTEREIRNLAALCVDDAYRAQGLLLVRAALKDRNGVYTDLSPSGNVVAMNERLGFRRLDTSTRLVLNSPAPPKRGIVVSSAPATVAGTLRGPDAQIYRDHRAAAAARHLVVRRGEEYAYLVFRADRRKGLRLFASPLYAGGDRDLLREAWSQVRSHLLLAHRLPLTLAERRILGFAEGIGREQGSPRPKMVRGDIDDSSVDYLYSELALVSW